MLNKKQISIAQLAQYLNISNIECMKYLNRCKGVGINVDNRERLKDVVGLILGKGLESMFQDRARAEGMYDNLLKAIGPNGYKPFVSSELGKAHGALLGSQKAMQDWANILLKVMGTGQPGTNQGPVINITNQNSNEANHNYLTIEKAIDMVAEEKQQMLLDPDTHKALEAQYITNNNLPEILASKQEYEAQGGLLVEKPKRKSRDVHEDHREGSEQANIIET